MLESMPLAARRPTQILFSDLTEVFPKQTSKLWAGSMDCGRDQWTVGGIDELCLYALDITMTMANPREVEAVRDAAWASADAHPSVVFVPRCVSLQTATEVRRARTT